MKRLTGLCLATLMFMCSLPATAESGLTIGNIINISKAHLARLPWAKDATYDVQVGKGNTLGRWIVVVSCTTCFDQNEKIEQSIIVLSISESGAVLCTAYANGFVCDKPMNGRGGITSQRFVVTNSNGIKIKGSENYESGGGRAMSVAVFPKR